MADVLGDFLSRMGQMQQIKTEQQQQTLRDYEIQKAERAAQPGSLENILRQTATDIAQNKLKNIDTTNAAATDQANEARIQAHDEAMVQLIDAGADGQKVLEASPFYQEGMKFTTITVAGSPRPAYLKKGAKIPEFISDADRKSSMDINAAILENKSKLKGFEVTPSGQNTMNNIIDSAFGGIYDPVSGKSTFEDQDSALRSAQVKSMAGSILKQANGALTENQAAGIALETYGISLPKTSQDFSALPDATKYKNRQIKDNSTGEVLRSDGNSWIDSKGNKVE